MSFFLLKNIDFGKCDFRRCNLMCLGLFSLLNACNASVAASGVFFYTGFFLRLKSGAERRREAKTHVLFFFVI